MNQKQHMLAVETPHHVNRAKKIAHEIESYFQGRQQHILEFNCGNGLLASLLQHRITTGELIDPSSEQVLLTEKRLVDQHQTQFKVTQAHIETHQSTQRYQMIYAALTLHQINDIKATLSHCYELLAPNGKLIIVELLPDDGTFYQDTPLEKSYHGFEMDVLEAHLKTSGFEQTMARKFFSGYKPLNDGTKHPYSLFSVQAIKS